jgi:2-hydroxychromene-2-carboxylate isomerase
MPDLRRHLRDTKNPDQPRAGLSVHLLNSILHFQKDTVMKAPVEFWFDFVSPYAYIAAQSIEQLAARHGREVSWKPMLLGAVFKVTGSSPLTMRPPQMADYFKHDFLRSARYAGVPFVLPELFPIATQNTSRVCLWLQDTAPQRVGEFVRQVTRAYFSDRQH